MASSSSSSSSSSSLSEEICVVEEKIWQTEEEIQDAESKIDFQNLGLEASIYWRKEKEQLCEKKELLCEEKLLLMKYLQGFKRKFCWMILKSFLRFSFKLYFVLWILGANSSRPNVWFFFSKCNDKSWLWNPFTTSKMGQFSKWDGLIIWKSVGSTWRGEQIHCHFVLDVCDLERSNFALHLSLKYYRSICKCPIWWCSISRRRWQPICSRYCGS